MARNGSAGRVRAQTPADAMSAGDVVEMVLRKAMAADAPEAGGSKDGTGVLCEGVAGAMCEGEAGCEGGAGNAREREATSGGGARGVRGVEAADVADENGATYSIGQVARMTGFSVSALRYYDERGVMPFLKKDKGGNRVFRVVDLQWLQVIDCMKVSGFSLGEMREYADLVRQGDATLQQRLALFEEHRERTLRKIEELQASLDGLNYKCWYYREAVQAGTESVHFTESGYDQAVCYRRFKEWEEDNLDEPSRIWTLFGERGLAGDAEPTPAALQDETAVEAKAGN